MTLTPWVVLRRGNISCIYLSQAEAITVAADLQLTAYRDRDVAIAPRPAIHPGWGLRWRGEGRR